MHNGCNGQMTDGMAILNKIRMMGFNKNQTPVVHKFECEDCGETVEMTTLEFACTCGMVYAVTPCSANNIERIKAAGKYV